MHFHNVIATMPKIVKSRKTRSSAALLGVLAAVLAAGAAFLLWNRFGGREPAIQETSQLQWQHPVEPADTGHIPGIPESEEPGIETPQSLQAQQPEPGPVPRDNPCQRVCSQIDRFFQSLDRQSYLQTFGLEGTSRQHFSELLETAFSHPPVVVRETDKLVTILQNTAHFYRIFGRQNIQLVKAVLEHESERLEPMAALFYERTLLDPSCQDSQDLELPLAGLYEYAGFFLNTLGGQAYLFRRAPEVRLLTRYYSILILDRANEQGINKYGFDIRPMIDTAIAEMEASRSLAFKDKYLEKLRELQFKYYTQYGGDSG